MAEIDSLGTNYYYSGVQNASNEAIKRNTKKEEVKKAGGKKVSFAKLMQGEEAEESQFVTEGLNLPPEVAAMSIDEAAVFLADAVSMAGNDFSEEQTQENLDQFKTSVRQFITFIVNNNFEVKNHKQQLRPKKGQLPPSRLFYFSDYNVRPKTTETRFKIDVINKKLDELARETLSNQMNNLQILAQVNEIKGLIVDLMSS
ncbi:YaaR family protein [Treponema bryantii]|uniref:YaaR family protein n=1 Tax=Treponema bryantii TaxID=163 RepID=UPI0003B5D28B|nr:YaaR family protein [Treponema bryantii]